MTPGAVGKSRLRNRWLYAALAGVTIAVGLFVRSPWAELAPVVAKYAGVALYAVMMFWLAGWLLKTCSTRTVAFSAIAFCWAIEFGQLVRTPWLDAFRQTTPGRLVLGSVFSWWDVVASAVGVLLAAASERLANAAYFTPFGLPIFLRR